MGRLFAGLATALLVGWPAAAQAPAALRTPPAAVAPLPAGELGAYVDGLVEAAMAKDHIAGVTVSVVQNGQVVFKKGYGFASFTPARPVDPDRTLFRIGSITKTFTWIGVMRQVEAGRMKLDAPIDDYLPPRLRIGAGKFGAIKVENLMDHSPGFEDHIFGSLFADAPSKVRSLADFLAQERPARVRAPGTVSSYSNYGAGLAGAALANVEGKEIETVVEDAITGPLGMAHTTLREPRPARAGLPAPMPTALAADVSQGFRWTSGGFEARGFEYIGQIAPAGAGSSTAGDMARYMLALLGGGTLDGVTIYGPKAAEAFRTPVRPVPPGVIAWRHGFYDQPAPGGRWAFGHNGGTVSFLSNMVIVPELDLGVFISTNTETGGPLQDRLPRAIVAHFYGPEPGPPLKGDPKNAAALKAFAGHYLSTRRAASGLEGFAHQLAFGADVSATPQGLLSMGGLAGRRLFAPDGDPAGGRFLPVDGDGGLLVFAMKDGKPVRILAGAAEVVKTGPIDTPANFLLLGVLTVATAILTLVGLALRRRSEIAPTAAQVWGSRTQTLQALAWIAAAVAVGVFFSRASDQARVIYDWPSPALIAASALMLAASLLALVTLGLTPAVWLGKGWTLGRKLRFSMTVALSTGFGLMLFHWHALGFWTS